MRRDQIYLATMAALLSTAVAGCGAATDSAGSSNVVSETSAENASQPAAVAAAPAVAPMVIEPPVVAPAEAPVKSPAAVRQRDLIRGKGGLEEKCLAQVEREVGAPVIGTNRIDESQASVEIYVNVQGAQAPWKCRANRSGSIEGIEYTGDEGYM